MLLPYFHLVDLYFLLLMIAFMNKLHFLHWFEMLLLLYLIYNVSLCVFHLLLDFLFPLLVFYYYSKLYAFNCSFMTFMYWLNYYSFIICFYFWKTDNHSILLSFPSDFSLFLFIWTLESACLSCWVFPWCWIFLPEDMNFLVVSVLFCVLQENFKVSSREILKVSI